MRTSDMIKSKYYRGRDLEGRPAIILTIADVTEELMGRGAGRAQDIKCFLWFMEGTKGLQLNKGRVAALEYAYGPDSDLWVGKKVRLSFDPTVMFGDKAVGGVKLETPAGVKYAGPPVSQAAWGDPVVPPVVPPGAPPPPRWNAQTGQWEVSQPVATIAPQAPPPPVWNPTTGAWETVNPGTGEIAGYSGPPKTISQRVQEGRPPEAWGGEAPAEDFNDKIPF